MPPRDASNQFFLARERTLDRGAHAGDFTPRGRSVNARRSVVALWIARRSTARATEFVREIERGHHRDALGRMDLAALPNLAHSRIEERDGVPQLRFLALLARELVVVAEKRYVERHHRRARRGLRLHSAGSGSRATSTSSRRFASATRSESAWLRVSAAVRPRRSASFAARSPFAYAISAARRCSSAARSESIVVPGPASGGVEDEVIEPL